MAKRWRGLVTFGDRQKPKRPGDLNWETRAVVGLMFMGYGLREAAEVLNVESDCIPGFRKFWGLARKSKNKLIVHAKINGLPPSCAATIQGSIFCPGCRQSISAVPCQRCATEVDEEIDARPARDEPLPEPVLRTSYEPGSQEKIRVMRGRASRGESCFHREDATL